MAAAVAAAHGAAMAPAAAPWGRLVSSVSGYRSYDLVENCVRIGRHPRADIVLSGIHMSQVCAVALI